MTLIPGPVAYLIYRFVVKHLPDQALGLFQSREAIGNLVAGFSFSMLGFLAAVITILFAFVPSEAFQRYKRVGYLNVLFSLYTFTVVHLVITSIISLYSFSAAPFVWPFRLMIVFFVNSLVQVTLITFIINNLARNASQENSST